MELFRQAFTIMAVGMALVFAFLAVVIGAIELAARVIHGVEGVPVDEDPAAGGLPVSPDNRRVAALAAALYRFRNG